MTEVKEPYWQRNLRLLGIGLLGFIFFNALWLWLLSAPLVSQLSNPDNIKDWTEDSGVYESLLPTIVEQAGRGTTSSVGSSEYEITNTIDQQVLTEIFSDALPPEAMQSYTEEIVDGVYDWLEGNTTQPQFNLELNDRREAIADALADYVRLKLADAPRCSAMQLAGEFDPLAQNCLPPGRSVESLASDYRQELLREGGLLGESTITADSFIEQMRQDHVAATGQPGDIDEALEEIPRYYNRAVQLPWYFLVVAILSGVGIIALSRNRWSSSRWLSLKVALTALGITAITFVVSWVFGTLLDRVAIDVEQRTVNLTRTLEPLYQTIVSQLAMAVYWYTIPIFLLGIVAFIVITNHLKKADKQNNQ